MGKSAKKSPKVDAAAPPPTQPVKKDKREAEGAVDKQVVAKKQKKDEPALKQATEKQKAKPKPSKKNKEAESNSSPSVEVKPGVKQPEGKSSDCSGVKDNISCDEDVLIRSLVPSTSGKVGKLSSEDKLESTSLDGVYVVSKDDEVTKSKIIAKSVPVAAAANKNGESSIDHGNSSSPDDAKSDRATSKSKKSIAIATKTGSLVIEKNEGSMDSTETEEDLYDEDVPSSKPASLEKPSSTIMTEQAVESKKGSEKEDTSESNEVDKNIMENHLTVAEPKQMANSIEEDISEEKSLKDVQNTPKEMAPSPKSPSLEKPSSTVLNKQAVESRKDSEKKDISESSEVGKNNMKLQPNVAEPKQMESGTEEDISKVESFDEVQNTQKEMDTEVDMIDAESSNSGVKKSPQTSPTPSTTTGSKTVFVGNLSFSVEQTDVESLFKDVGEIANIRFGIDDEGIFKGFGHVEFATVEAAQKALELNGQQLLGRRVKLDLAREKGSRTPTGGYNNENSYHKGGRAHGRTIYVKGFDTSDTEEKIRSAIEEHFGSCGGITRVSIPRDYGGALKGHAYVDFTYSDGTNKALELNGSRFGEGTLTVEEKKPRGDFVGSGRSDGGYRFSNRGRGFDGILGGPGRFNIGDGGGRFSRAGPGGVNRYSMTPTGPGRAFYH